MANFQGQGMEPGAGSESHLTSQRRHLMSSIEALIVGIVLLATAIAFQMGGNLRSAVARSPGAAATSILPSVPTTAPGGGAPASAHMGLTASGASTSARTFSYGYDLATAMSTGVNPAAAQRAAQVAKTMPASFQVVPIMGWGQGNPEISPGVFDFSQIAKQLTFVQASGATPVITLCGAPDWMKGLTAGTTDWTQLGLPPIASHYQDFAALSAAVAKAFPQVKYFVVWSELRGFWSPAFGGWDAGSYTSLYNDVYLAVKSARPDALVGGPYVSVGSGPGPAPARFPTPSGPWGHLQVTSLSAISYWLKNNVGADFVAVDGKAFTANFGLVTDPVTSTGKYAAVDQWLVSQTALPIVWMESHVVPDPTIVSQQQQAAIRIAALLQMASSGASLGMQWNPTQDPTWDEGIWNDVTLPSGGQPTVLAQVLPAVLNVLAAPVVLVPSSPPGTLIANGVKGTVTVTYSASAASVTVTGPAH